MESSYTEDFTHFGIRERKILIDLLTAWNNNGLPDGFYDENVRPAFNRMSGYVFLVNEEFQAVMLHDGKLALWHFTPYEGHEGFLDELMNLYRPEDLNREDIQYIREQPEYNDILASGEYPAWEQDEDDDDNTDEDDDE